MIEKVSALALRSFWLSPFSLALSVTGFLLQLVSSQALSANPDSIEHPVAVLVVDVQACFVEGGSLAVPKANSAYVQRVENAIRTLKESGYLILGSRDYHPEGHISFASAHPGKKPFDSILLSSGRKQTLWPDHCVQTRGDSRALVDNNLFFELIKKGQNKAVDSYSVFADDAGTPTELDPILKTAHVKRLVVFGLATDFCVLATVLDAVKRGYSVVLVETLSLGITESGQQRALAQMRAKGVTVVNDLLELRSFLNENAKDQSPLSARPIRNGAGWTQMSESTSVE